MSPALDDEPAVLTLRPIPGAPWIGQFPEHGASLVDLRPMVLAEDRIESATLNGRPLMVRHDKDDPRLFGVSPLVPLEGGYLVITLARPVGGRVAAERGPGNTKVAGRTIAAPTPPRHGRADLDLRQGLLPPGARV